ncbi:MAG: hypothetical protein C0614_03870 [Desulfuromonas sp.]|nr:MAG: hypothetical protein C0614_03870 [Desulfuromonas sp.]
MCPHSKNPLSSAQAGYDQPTGLPSRAMFFDRLQQSLLKAHRDGKVAAVFFVRVDRFKVINDTFGKNVGNSMLAEISNRFKQVLRQSDTLGRPGRDEFMVLLPEISKSEDASIVANKLIDALRTPFTVAGTLLFININIGISIFPDDTTDPEELLRCAYTAKIGSIEDGKNKFRYYSPAISQKAFKLLKMESELRLALEKNEFILHYQPVICAKKLSLSSMEALIRWKHPTQGLVNPSSFLGVAEQSEIISQIGSWVMEEVFSQKRAWINSGVASSRVAINLSARQFSSASLVDDISRMLETHRVDPQLFEFEVTESSLIHSMGDVELKFRKIREMGAKMALDDFGTGYSSLSYLRNLPFDRVKIDRSFVSNITLDQRDVAIASAIIELAHALGMKVTGEGVETKEQMEILCSINCDEIQGYLFSPPVDSDCMKTFLSSPQHPAWSKAVYL